jgi:hypothetical protein
VVAVAVRANGTWVTKARRPPTEPLVRLTVEVSSAELAALSFVAVVVTSCGPPALINAANRGLRTVRQAAARHPDLPVHLRTGGGESW